mmetsp:Transcript_17882/g.32374  ORF Transcript_17882/g.32374 Transcript_17882/m.32374 type:complete len:212 (+) Transcript_17882:1704-2339(+)
MTKVSAMCRPKKSTPNTTNGGSQKNSRGIILLRGNRSKPKTSHIETIQRHASHECIPGTQLLHHEGRTHDGRPSIRQVQNPGLPRPHRSQLRRGQRQTCHCTAMIGRKENCHEHEIHQGLTPRRQTTVMIVQRCLHHNYARFRLSLSLSLASRLCYASLGCTVRYGEGCGRRCKDRSADLTISEVSGVGCRFVEATTKKKFFCSLLLACYL